MLKRKELSALIFRSVRLAHAQYKEWTYDYFVSDAPESFIQVELARSLASFHYVTLETPVEEVIEGYEKRCKGKISRSRSEGRIDIVCWDDNDCPILAFELKRAWKKDAIKKDVERLGALVNSVHELNLGVSVVVTDAKEDKAGVEKLLKEMDAPNTTLVWDVFSDKYKNDTWYCGIGCYFISG